MEVSEGPHFFGGFGGAHKVPTLGTLHCAPSRNQSQIAMTLLERSETTVLVGFL